MYPIAVQLFSLRDMIQPGYEKEDFLQILKWVAAVGYKGVQPAGLWGYTPAEVTKIVEDLGMSLAGTHSPFCRKVEDISAAVDAAGAMKCDLIAAGFGEAEFASIDAIKKTAELVNAMNEACQRQGCQLYLHNHAHEFAKIDGRIAYEIFEELCPEVKYEIDAYWSCNHGANDPAEMVRNFRDKCVLLHLKDGTFDKHINMLPLGTGKMNIPAVIDACNPAVNQWVIVELDNCCIDMMRAIKQSYRYMVSNGLAAGNK
ncbi:MAG: sugar phosphate isomerase/epimerase [Lentisphaeria bacterium]|nr:sugar phosphate isomerase/epimerase [Lentisphaeria bacterium]